MFHLRYAGVRQQAQEHKRAGRYPAHVEGGRCGLPVEREHDQRAQDRARVGHQVLGLRTGSSASLLLFLSFLMGF